MAVMTGAEEVGREAGGENYNGDGDGIPREVGSSSPAATEAGLRRRARVEHENITGWKGKLKDSMWHGGTWFDAWLSAVAGQVFTSFLSLSRQLSLLDLIPLVLFCFFVFFKLAYGLLGF
jgi:hypothetical protein